MKKIALVILALLLLFVTVAQASPASTTMQVFMRYGEGFWYWTPEDTRYIAVVYEPKTGPLRQEVTHCQVVIIPLFWTCLTYVMPQYDVWYQEDATFPEAYWDLAGMGVRFQSDTKTLNRANIHLPINGACGGSVICPPAPQGYP